VPGSRVSNTLNNTDQQQPPIFDIYKDLIPPTFIARTPIPSTVVLAPIPPQLEEYINASVKGSESLWIFDLQNLFSYGHLGFLYSSFLSPNGIKPGSDKKHPLWAELAKYIEPPSLTVLKSTWAPGEPHPMSGLSTVFCDYRTELATNFSNMWDGPLYSKSLDFLLRFSLRFQLAPDREMRYYTRVQELAQKKLQQKDHDKKRPLTFKAWKDRTEDMEQELGELLARSGTRTDQIVASLSLLADQAAREPEVVREACGDSVFDRADLIEETRLILEITEEALDEVDKEAEEEEKIAGTGTEGNQRRATTSQHSG